MTNRVALGDVSGRQTLRVSKPGRNVLTAGADDLLLDTDQKMVQIVQSGRHSNDSRDVSLPDLGFEPFVVADNCSVEYRSRTSLRFRRLGDGAWQYMVLNIPRG